MYLSGRRSMPGYLQIRHLGNRIRYTVIRQLGIKIRYTMKSSNYISARFWIRKRGLNFIYITKLQASKQTNKQANKKPTHKQDCISGLDHSVLKWYE